MRRIAIIQARMTSTRLPGKVLMDLCGAPMLAQQLRRVRRCAKLDGVAIATTINLTDDPVVRLAAQEKVGCFRGSEADVLSRFLGAAHQERADIVVRLTADCPLIDAEVIDQVVGALEDNPGVDYCSNVLERSYPRGLDAEAFLMSALERCDELGTTPGAREHVTTVIRLERPELFHTMSVRDTADNSDLRWTVDTPADLELIRHIYKGLNLAVQYRGYREVIARIRNWRR
jgi:spore coat polysaccharide biosynthesis protein SpsF